jgi:hypothetical protein
MFKKLTTCRPVSGGAVEKDGPEGGVARSPLPPAAQQAVRALLGLPSLCRGFARLQLAPRGRQVRPPSYRSTDYETTYCPYFKEKCDGLKFLLYVEISEEC